MTPPTASPSARAAQLDAAAVPSTAHELIARQAYLERTERAHRVSQEVSAAHEMRRRPAPRGADRGRTRSPGAGAPQGVAAPDHEREAARARASISTRSPSPDFAGGRMSAPITPASADAGAQTSPPPPAQAASSGATGITAAPPSPDRPRPGPAARTGGIRVRPPAAPSPPTDGVCDRPLRSCGPDRTCGRPETRTAAPGRTTAGRTPTRATELAGHDVPRLSCARRRRRRSTRRR